MNVGLGTSRLLLRLAVFVPLSADESRALESSATTVRLFRPHEDLVREGESAPHVGLLVSGFAYRCRVLPDGRRQVVSYLIPGDLCDARQLLVPMATHTVSSLVASNAVMFSRDSLLALMNRYPRIAQALCWLTLLEEQIAREWLVNVGQRTALERLAHLLCEIYARMQAVSLTDGGRCELPLTQVDLADTLALSTVHVNRTLQELRRRGLVSLSGGMLEIHDFDTLQSVAMFSPDYLHPGVQSTERKRRHLPG